MTRLVDDLLMLARGDSGGSLDLAPVALGPLVIDVRHTSRHLDDRLTVEVEGSPVVEGDEDSLTRLVRILLDNAERYSDGPIVLSMSRREGVASYLGLGR